MAILALDIGGTKILGGITEDLEHWDVLHLEKSIPDTEETMYEAVRRAIHLTAEKADLPLSGIEVCSIVLPGQVDRQNGIACYQNNLPWRDFPLRERLLEDFSFSAVLIEHDVMAAAIGEHSVRKSVHDGPLFCYVTVSTGISASLLLNGEPLTGQGLAGEIGFLPVRKTSLEDFASGRAMEEAVRKTWGIPSLAEAMKRWEERDPVLQSFFEDRAAAIAGGIFSLTTVTDPFRIVIGGGVIQHQPLFYERIVHYYKALCTHPLQLNWPLRLERSSLSGMSGLYGAAAGALTRYESKVSR